MSPPSFLGGASPRSDQLRDADFWLATAADFMLAKDNRFNLGEPIPPRWPDGEWEPFAYL